MIRVYDVVKRKMDETCFPFATLFSVICCCQALHSFFLMTFQGKLPSSLQTDSNATLVFTERNLYIFLCTVLPLLEINIEAFDLRYQRVYLSAINYFRIMQKRSIHEILFTLYLFRFNEGSNSWSIRDSTLSELAP